MDANALQMMVLPVLAGLCLGSALGALGLAVVRSIGVLAGLGHGRAPVAPGPVLDATGRGR